MRQYVFPSSDRSDLGYLVRARGVSSLPRVLGTAFMDRRVPSRDGISLSRRALVRRLRARARVRPLIFGRWEKARVTRFAHRGLRVSPRFLRARHSREADQRARLAHRRIRPDRFVRALRRRGAETRRRSAQSGSFGGTGSSPRRLGLRDPNCVVCFLYRRLEIIVAVADLSRRGRSLAPRSRGRDPYRAGARHGWDFRR